MAEEREASEYFCVDPDGRRQDAALWDEGLVLDPETERRSRLRTVLRCVNAGVEMDVALRVYGIEAWSADERAALRRAVEAKAFATRPPKKG
jgi:hypothetical protein